MNSKLVFSILSFSDKILVVFIILVSAVLGAFVRPHSVVVVSPFSELKLSTSFLSHGPGMLSALQGTEDPILQGAGLGRITRLLSPVSVGAQVLPKLFMLMAAVWLLG